MQKQIKLKHGISENGELQVYRVDQIIDDAGKVLTEKTHSPYTPKDPKIMDGFDNRSKEIVAAITTPEAKAEFEKEKHVMTGKGIEEIVTYDRVIEEDGKIAVRRITRIFDDGKEVSKKYHRSWIMPGDDPEGKDVMSKVLAKKFHTPKIVKEHKEKLAKQKIRME